MCGLNPQHPTQIYQATYYNTPRLDAIFIDTQCKQNQQTLADAINSESNQLHATSPQSLFVVELSYRVCSKVAIFCGYLFAAMATSKKE